MNTYNMDKMYESYSSEVERMQKFIDELLQESKQLKEQLQNISNEFLKYDWKNATQEQFYNQLKSLYESIFKWSDSNE